MTERIVLRSPESKSDVRTITRYLVEVDLKIGLDFLSALQASCERLRIFPEMGQLSVQISTENRGPAYVGTPQTV